jgi:threonine synthase
MSNPGPLAAPQQASMGEGNTPLVPSTQIAPRGLSFKLENCNPSGSYKDRFIAAEVGRLRAAGATACVATSSGNTGSALAACCARYGLRCAILVNQDAPAGKLTQMQAHGARILRIPEFAASAEVTQSVFGLLENFAGKRHLPLVVSAYRYCPVGMAGVEGIAAELAIQSPEIAHVFVPVGGGGLFSAVCRGFRSAGKPAPAVHAVQPEGCLTVVASYLRGDAEIRSVSSTTRISGLSVPYDIDAALALGLLRACGGQGIPVSDAQVFQAQRLLLEREGIYCEPAGATALAGYLQALEKGTVSADEPAVCLVTGHGFKDPDSIREAASRNAAAVVEPAAVAQALNRFLEEAS